MSNRSKAQILIVDDDRRIRENLGMLLMFAGYDVATAENGATALLHMNRVLPDLIVTDLNMPHMSGVELMSHVRSSYPSVSIVAMSGDYQGEAMPPSVLADRFYPKGQNLKHLLGTIASLVATNTAHRSAHDESRNSLGLDS